MPTCSISDLYRRSRDIIAEALRHPVTIVQRNKPRLVILSIEDYRMLLDRADARTAEMLDAMPASLLREFGRAVEAYERSAQR